LTSTAIAPTPFAGWGALTYSRDTSAAGTALTVDVLDATGALLAANVASGADLSAIPALAGKTSLKLRANLATSNTASTPKLNDWSVAYLSALGSPVDSVWSSSVSSTQDSDAPTVLVTSPTLLETAQSHLLIQGTASDVAGVKSVTVNGVLADTVDGFGHWSATVKGLHVGLNTVTITALDNASPSNTGNTYWQVTGVPPVDTSGTGLPDAWRALYGITGGANDEIRNTGVTNYMAYALGLNPSAINRSDLPSISPQMNGADNLPYLTFSYRRLLNDVGVNYCVEVSSDFNTWSSASDVAEELSPPVTNPDGLTETVTVRIKPSLRSGRPASFVHLRLTPDM
jgi:hypothetical protein